MTHSDHDPDVQAEVIKDLTEHIVELEEQLDKHKESLRDMGNQLANTRANLHAEKHRSNAFERDNNELEARLQKAEQRAKQAEIAAGDCKFQNARLVARVKQAEEALRQYQRHVAECAPITQIHKCDCGLAKAISASTPTEEK